MTAINHEYFVSFEVAKLLKQAGFDWECKTCYIGKSKRPYKYHKYFNWNMPRKYFEKGGSDNLFHSFINQKNTSSFASAPTIEVAQKWLREIKKISVEVKTCRWVNRHKDGKYTVSYRHELWPINTSIVPNNEDKFIRYTIDYACNIEFQTYEEAQEAGIKKALELILEKGK